MRREYIHQRPLELGKLSRIEYNKGQRGHTEAFINDGDGDNVGDEDTKEG